MTDAGQQHSTTGQNDAGDPKTLTTRQGHPVYDNQNTRTVGARGPATLENYQLLEKISHFDRERIPERVVHARGFVAYGEFEASGKWGDEPIAKYTRAKLFSEPGKKTDVAIRFSSVIGGRDSSEAARDPRGFAIKFYTEDGNWDLVGNNLGVFFIRDAIKFPDVIHSLKPDPVTFRQEPARLVQALLLSVCYWLFDAACLWVLVAAFGHPLNPGELLIAYGLANLVALAPLTPGGLGLVEGVLVPTLVGFGAANSAAVLGVLSWRIANFWLPIPVGGLAWLSLRVGVLRRHSGAPHRTEPRGTARPRFPG